jgi:hypothetical protein
LTNKLDTSLYTTFDIYSNEFYFWEIIHTLLTKGRGYSCPFLEEHVFNMLKNDGKISFWMN